jgi:hypothetical protein
VREWVTTEAGRAEQLGTILLCVKCAEGAGPDTVADGTP